MKTPEAAMMQQMGSTPFVTSRHVIVFVPMVIERGTAPWPSCTHDGSYLGSVGHCFAASSQTCCHETSVRILVRPVGSPHQAPLCSVALYRRRRRELLPPLTALGVVERADEKLSSSPAPPTLWTLGSDCGLGGVVRSSNETDLAGGSS